MKISDIKVDYIPLVILKGKILKCKYSEFFGMEKQSSPFAFHNSEF